MASVKGKLEKKNNSSSNELTNTLILGLVGLILLLIPDTLNKLLGIVVGLGLLILGIYSIYQYFQQKLFTSNMISGILYSILGLIVLLYPGSVIRAVAIGIGFALIVIGLSKLRQALILKNVNTKWIGTLVVSILILILGFLLVFNPFSGVAITKLAGAFLLIVAIFNVVDNCVFQK